MILFPHRQGIWDGGPGLFYMINLMIETVLVLSKVWEKVSVFVAFLSLRALILSQNVAKDCGCGLSPLAQIVFFQQTLKTLKSDLFCLFKTNKGVEESVVLNQLSVGMCLDHSFSFMFGRPGSPRPHAEGAMVDHEHRMGRCTEATRQRVVCVAVVVNC